MTNNHKQKISKALKRAYKSGKKKIVVTKPEIRKRISRTLKTYFKYNNVSKKTRLKIGKIMTKLHKQYPEKWRRTKQQVKLMSQRSKKYSVENPNIMQKCVDAMRKANLKRKYPTGILSTSYVHGQSRKNPYSTKFKNLRKDIRKRDNYKCQLCGLTEKKHLIILNSVLAIHHINYNIEDNRKKNLISLCYKCNTKANFNRDYYYAYFTYIIEDSLTIGGLIK